MDFGHEIEETGRAAVAAGKGSLEKVMEDIFISYAREDRPAALRVAEALKRHGWAVWWIRISPPATSGTS